MSMKILYININIIHSNNNSNSKIFITYHIQAFATGTVELPHKEIKKKIALYRPSATYSTYKYIYNVTESDTNI